MNGDMIKVLKGTDDPFSTPITLVCISSRSLVYNYLMGQTLPIYTSELQERRSAKLQKLRQRGKGPPKKGSGKRSK
jgi:hypothetical protein